MHLIQTNQQLQTELLHHGLRSVQNRHDLVRDRRIRGVSLFELVDDDKVGQNGAGEREIALPRERGRLLFHVLGEVEEDAFEPRQIVEVS